MLFPCRTQERTCHSASQHEDGHVPLPVPPTHLEMETCPSTPRTGLASRSQAIFSKLVVHAPLFRIAEHLIRCRNFPEFLLGALLGIGVPVRMVLPARRQCMDGELGMQNLPS